MRGGDRGPRGGATLKDLRNIGTVRRLFAFIFANYKISLIVVLVCIVISSLTSLASSLFTRTLIDDYILPMLSSQAASDLLGDAGVGWPASRRAMPITSS